MIIGVDATKQPEQPQDGDGFSCRNVGTTSHFEAAICQRKIHCLHNS